ncbi:hypothetical protein D3C81_2069020 [compost metagenome]
MKGVPRAGVTLNYMKEASTRGGASTTGGCPEGQNGGGNRRTDHYSSGLSVCAGSQRTPGEAAGHPLLHEGGHAAFLCGGASFCTESEGAGLQGVCGPENA